MKKYQKRVIKEKEKLNKKIFKLAHFLNTHEQGLLSGNEFKRLRWQFFAMAAYLECLEERIRHF